MRTLASHDLVDVYRLLLYPAVLGSGTRMFDDGGLPASFALTASTVTHSGIVMLSYERARSG